MGLQVRSLDEFASSLEDKEEVPDAPVSGSPCAVLDRLLCQFRGCESLIVSGQQSPTRFKIMDLLKASSSPLGEEVSAALVVCFGFFN